MPLTPAVVQAFRCPTCHASMDVSEGTRVRCLSCGFAASTVDDVLDLVRDERRGEERAFYDDFYAHAPEHRPPESLASLASTWTEPTAPWEMRLVWRRLGDLRDRTVLLLGNGESFNELYLMTQKPRALIYSDLSPVGLRQLRRHVEAGHDENLVFVAIDALDLPLRDRSVDVVYGFAFAHHLPDIERFVAEVARVLRPGGRAVFMDNAYSPLWQHLKLVWLRPVMWLSHRQEPRSPEDVRDTMRGGFREEQLAAVIHRIGGRPWFDRIALLYYLWHRASVALFPGLFRIVPRHDTIAAALMRADQFLARYAWLRKNAIRLVWGFDKPSTPPARGAGT